MDDVAILHRDIGTEEGLRVVGEYEVAKESRLPWSEVPPEWGAKAPW